jgi:hypothetical protein
MWNITAQLETVSTTPDGTHYWGSMQLPAFQLNGGIQGILSQCHAEKIAREVIDPLGLYGYAIHVHAQKVS